MVSAGSLTSTQFADALTSESIQVTRLIHAAIMIGPLVFLMVIVVFASQNVGGFSPQVSDFEIMNILSTVHGILVLLAILLAQFLSGVLFSPDRLTHGEESIPVEMLAARCVALQRTAGIGRLAILEGASLFGLAVCFVGVTNHVIHAEALYWFNAASTGLFLLFAAAVFPTRQNLIDWFELRFGYR